MTSLTKRKLGRTDLMVTELGFGAMDTPQTAEGEETLALAVDLGINYVDTARIYQNSEFLIGQVIRTKGEANFFLASKTIDRTLDGSQYDVDRSLRFLGVDKIDLYQVDDVLPEDWDQVMAPGGSLEGLQTAKFRGLIDHIGISSHSLEIVEKAITCGEFDTVMLEYSAFYRETEQLIALANEMNVGVIAMRPVGGSGRMSSLRTKILSSQGEYPITPALLLRYTLSNPGVSVAIVGARYPSRVKENVATLSSYEPLTPEEKRQCETEADLFYQPV